MVETCCYGSGEWEQRGCGGMKRAETMLCVVRSEDRIEGWKEETFEYLGGRAEEGDGAI